MSKTIIDAHSHIVPQKYVAVLERSGRLLEDGFPCPKWSMESQRAYMESVGIQHCLLSVSSPHQMVGTAEEGLQLTRELNEQMAQMVKVDPAAFSFAACLPLPLVEESVTEAVRALDKLGACAVKFPSNADGLYPGDEALAPLMDVLNERRAVVLLHPCKPPVVPQNCYTAGPLPLFEFLGDTTRAVINLLTAKVTERWPNVRFVVPHSGSFLPPLVDRLTGMTRAMAANGKGTAVDVRAALENFYFDLAGDALPAAVPALLKITTPDHLLFGGDFPYTPPQMVREHMDALLNDPQTAPFAERIFYENARKLLRLS